MRPEQKHTYSLHLNLTFTECWSFIEKRARKKYTNQKVNNRAEDDGGEGTHGDVRQDFSQEVDGDPVVAADVLVPAPDTKPHQHPCDPDTFWVKNVKRSLSCYIHKELPLQDEELSCRHSAETLVRRDEEEGTHPADADRKQASD